VIAAVQEPLREVRADETGAASDQIAQRASSKGLGIVVMIAGESFFGHRI
jgi:hypothetical protein